PAPTLLLTHGSSRREAQEEFCQLCTDLHCLPASWRMAPWLGDRLQQYPGAHVMPYLIRSLPTDIEPFIASLGGTLLPNPLPPRAIATLTIQQFSRSMDQCDPVHWEKLTRAHATATHRDC
ncbi:MAG: hypothetical protein HC919_12305, partial [Oscillatoriales cyanobacterium SM2_2_1]|nr:hypothetical protein [Oscillatoriales cyanobacterium SM2_2_1]